MKLYIKEKVFSWGDKFTVIDEYGRDAYTVEGEIFSWGKKLHIFDRHGREVMFIGQKLWSFLHKYAVTVSGEEIAEIVREFSFFRPYYTINGPEWTVDGSFWEHEYEIRDKYGAPIAEISKEWMTWGDSYELTVFNEEYALAALAVLIVIDCVAEANNN